MDNVTKEKKQLAKISAVLRLARRLGVDAVVHEGGKKYKLLAIDPSSIDADHLPSYLKKRVKKGYK